MVAGTLFLGVDFPGLSKDALRSLTRPKVLTTLAVRSYRSAGFFHPPTITPEDFS